MAYTSSVAEEQPSEISTGSTWEKSSLSGYCTTPLTMPLMYTIISFCSLRFWMTKESRTCSSSLYWVLMVDCSEAKVTPCGVTVKPRQPDMQVMIGVS